LVCSSKNAGNCRTGGPVAVEICATGKIRRITSNVPASPGNNVNNFQTKNVTKFFAKPWKCERTDLSFLLEQPIPRKRTSIQAVPGIKGGDRLDLRP
jgi:hypothetical protein